MIAGYGTWTLSLDKRLAVGIINTMKISPSVQIAFAILLLLAGLTITLGSIPVSAAPAPQLTTFVTPTPGTDGRIIYVVQEGDTLWRIAAIAGMNVADLRDLNNLDPDDIVFPGQQLFLGTGGPAVQDSPEVSEATPTPQEPTQTPVPGTGTLCVLLFEDVNGDSMRQEEEISLGGGALNISNRDGSVSITADTPEHNPDPLVDDYYCLEELMEGEYNVSVAIPEGYNPTTVLNVALDLEAGDTTYLTFGAQAGSVVIEEEEILPESTGGTPLLGVIGLVMLIGGIGLGVYTVWFRR